MKKTAILLVVSMALAACVTNKDKKDQDSPADSLTAAPPKTDSIPKIDTVLKKDSSVIKTGEIEQKKNAKTEDAAASKVKKDDKKTPPVKVSPNNAPNQKELDEIKKKKTEEKGKDKPPKGDLQPDNNG